VKVQDGTRPELFAVLELILVGAADWLCVKLS